jgi:hypothetical protein
VGQADAAIAVPYSPEYLQLGRNDGLLHLVARDGAGVLLRRAPQAWSLPPLPVPVSTDIFWFLILLCVLVWPLDIAARRITLRPRQLLANIGEYARERRMTDLEVTAPPELTRLRERVEGIRQRGRGPAGSAPAEQASGLEPASGGAGRAPGRSKPAPPAQPRAPAPPTVEEEALSARLLEARRKKRGKGT